MHQVTIRWYTSKVYNYKYAQTPLGVIFCQAQNMLWRLRTCTRKKKHAWFFPFLCVRYCGKYNDSGVESPEYLSHVLARVLLDCDIVFTQIQVKKSFAACPWRRASRVQISRLIGVYRRVSVFEQRRALLWLGPRVLHGRIPRELPEVDEWRPQHQPSNTQVWYLQNETEINFLFSLLRKYQTKFS